MEDNITKIKNEKIIYEQRKEKIKDELEKINSAEDSVNYYQMLKKKMGIRDASLIFIISLIMSTTILNNITSALFLSLGFGFAYISAFNTIKYQKMKKIRSQYANISFNNYNFDDSNEKKAHLNSEITEIEKKLKEFTTKLENTPNYNIMNKTEELNYEPLNKTKVLTKKLGRK